MSRLRQLRPIAIIVPLILVAAMLIGGAKLFAGDGSKQISAIFPKTISLFVGSDVRILGLSVGKVTAMTPTGTGVRVDMEYDGQYDLPADAKAVIISPSLIGDRFVQLTPAYDRGSVLPNGSVIGPANTRAPVELDRTFSATQQLLSALGPDGANRHGALSDLLAVGAKTLDGQGTSIRGTIGDLAAVTDTLSKGSDDAFGTIDQLSRVTTTLSTYDKEIGAFNERLGRVAASLADQSGDISELLKTLAGSLGEVEGFVRDNRESVGANVESLTTVAGALEGERQALADILDLAPLGFTNLVQAYEPTSAAVRTRANFGEILRALDLTACEALRKQGGDNVQPACDLLKTIFDQLPLRNGLGVPAPVKTGGTLGGAPASPELSPVSLPDLVGGLTGLLEGGS